MSIRKRSSFSDVDAASRPEDLIAILDRNAETLSDVKRRMLATLALQDDER